MKKKNRNYSFKNSKRISHNLTEVNGIPIPSLPGSCFHGIICALATNKNKFCNWDKIIELTEKYIRQYGGTAAWEKFKNKDDAYKQRIKDNCHTLTRTGRDCFGYRLHERGMAIYYFKDGAILYIGGEFSKRGDKYDVKFPDGFGLQVRYRGSTMTSEEYKQFLEKGWIDASGTVLDKAAILDFRIGLENEAIEPVKLVVAETKEENMVQVCITLSDEKSTKTISKKLQQVFGLEIESSLDTELIGTIPETKVESLQLDEDVLDVVVLSE